MVAWKACGELTPQPASYHHVDNAWGLAVLATYAVRLRVLAFAARESYGMSADTVSSRYKPHDHLCSLD